MNAIEAENLHYTYSDGTKALKGVTLNVKEGETVVILGANGSGKTTLLLILSCLLLPQKGMLKIMGEIVNKKNADEIRRRVGIVFQNPDDQVIAPTVYDDIAFGLRNLGFDESVIKKKVDEMLKRFDLEDLKDKNPDYLSGGQKKRVAIAGITIMDPDIVIMDEPTAGLDGKSFRAVLNIIEQFRGEKTLILSTHDIDFAEAVGDRFVYLNNGRVIRESDEVDYQFAEKLGLRCFLKGKILIIPKDVNSPEIEADAIFNENGLERAILKALEGKTVFLMCENGRIDYVKRFVARFPVYCDVMRG